MTNMYKRVLVAVNTSPISQKILDHAVAITDKFGSELKILTIIPKQKTYVHMPAGVYSHVITFGDSSKIEQKYTKFLADTKDKIKSDYPDLNVSTILGNGRPSVKIVELAEKEGCDLIIMGCRKIGRLLRLVDESTSLSVLDTSDIPILIIS